MPRSSTDDPEEVTQGSQVEVEDGSEVWFSKEAFRFQLAMAPSDEVRPKTSTGIKVENCWRDWTAVLWIRIQIGSIQHFVDPNPYLEYGSESTQVKKDKLGRRFKMEDKNSPFIDPFN